MKSIALTSMIVAGCLATAGCVPTPAAPPPVGTSFTYACSYGPMTVIVMGGAVTAYSGGSAITYGGGPLEYFGEEESLTFAADFSSVTWASLGERETCNRTG